MISQEKLDTILSRYEEQPANLIPVLQDIQDEYNYLPQDELHAVAGRLQVPLTQVYSVATFFKMFSLEPKGRHQVRVCLGTACHLRGGQRLVETVSRRLAVEVGHATQDMQFSLETVGCMGSCAQAPLMMIDDKYYGRMAVDKVPRILKLYKKQDQD
jgi:NADH-quinone oxidoreductase subunit E